MPRATDEASWLIGDATLNAMITSTMPISRVAGILSSGSTSVFDVQPLHEPVKDPGDHADLEHQGQAAEI